MNLGSNCAARDRETGSWIVEIKKNRDKRSSLTMEDLQRRKAKV